jgi:hypothetical protein
MRTETMITTRRGSILRRVALLPFLALTACGEGTPPVDPQGSAVASVEVTAPAATVAVGETMQLGATPRSRGGAAVPGVTVAWSSSNEAVATVSARGQVTAVAPGQATIRAAAGGRTGETTITVAPAAASSIEIQPGGEIQLAADGSVQLRAFARTAAGASLGQVPATWTSSDPRVARVTEDGIVHAGFGGTATVTATAAGRTAQATVRVQTRIETVLVLPGGVSLNPGGTAQMRARGLTAAHDTLDRPVQAWASENEGVATVDASGRVTAHRAGSAVIRATMEGVDGRMIIFVHGPTERRLERAAGQALPAQIGTRTMHDAAGAIHTQRVVATGGTLRFSTAGYEQRITLEIYEGAVHVATEVYEDRGEVYYQMMDGSPVLHSTARPGLQLPVALAMEHGFHTGEMTISQALAGVEGQVALRFGRP